MDTLECYVIMIVKSLHKILSIAILLAFSNAAFAQNCDDSPYRTFDGTCNNLQNPSWGAAGSIFSRLTAPYYDTDAGQMRDAINPRLISNLVCKQQNEILDGRGLSSFVYAWLQFIDHDITLLPESEEAAPIQIPRFDNTFDPYGEGNKEFHFNRSAHVLINGRREHENNITAWIDGSMVYGSTIERANWLRSHQNGKLKVSTSQHGDMLPFNTDNGEYSGNLLVDDVPRMAGDMHNGQRIKTFVAGDIRAGEQVVLTSLHTLFVREHNRICDELIKNGMYNDEEIYQNARAQVIGIIQNITYKEALPALGLGHLGYNEYDPYSNPNLSHEFSTAAFRLGHTMVPPFIPLLDEECSAAVYESYRWGQSAPGMLSLRQAFFNTEILPRNGMDAIFRGLASQTQQRIDNQIVDDLRDFLFTEAGGPGLDLASLNIQRSRDNGIGTFNEVRESIGLPPATQWYHITSDYELQQKLRTAYNNDINEVDAWVGMICEDHVPGTSIGRTVRRVLRRQFRVLRNGDRYWFTRNSALSYNQKTKIKETTLADVISRNTEVEGLADVFYTNECSGSAILPENYCQGGGQDSNYEYIRKVSFFTAQGEQSYQSGNDGGFANWTNDMKFDLSGQYAAVFRVFSGGDWSLGKHYKIWIDYNRDGDFDDWQEWTWSSYWTNDASGMFYFPYWIESGTYRMRIGMNYGNPWFAPCNTYYYGETEDYLIKLDFGAGERSENQVLSDMELQPNQPEGQKLNVFPNPATDYVQVVLDSREDENEAELTIMNTYGQRVMKEIVELRKGENTVRLDLPTNTQPGVYFVSTKQKDIRLQSKTFVIVKD